MTEQTQPEERADIVLYITQAEMTLAAEAIGMSVVGWIEAWNGSHWVELEEQRKPGDPPVLWNPLIDVGDCARLAAELQIDTHFRCVGGKRVEALPPGGPLIAQHYSEDHERMKAWHLAVVKAAAAYQKRKDSHSAGRMEKQ